MSVSYPVRTPLLYWAVVGALVVIALFGLAAFILGLARGGFGLLDVLALLLVAVPIVYIATTAEYRATGTIQLAAGEVVVPDERGRPLTLRSPGLREVPTRSEAVGRHGMPGHRPAGTAPVSAESEQIVADYLGMPPIAVREVTTFYNCMYNQRPVGKFKLNVCTNLPCQLRDGVNALEYLEGKLGIRMGETTPDGLFTLQQSECLGACADAPVLLVNDRTMCSFMSHEKLDQR